jgi:NosR/NirI family nitrous oxide reductase transcriptional regulator
MKQKLHILFTFAFLLLTLSLPAQKQRFPKPEFQNGYVQPKPVTPEPRANGLEYFDVVMLLSVLSLASWLAIKKRSRQGILWLSIFSLLYFGFYRQGCVCSIGSIQNVTLTFFDATYAISITALLFFLFPLIFTLFFGRTFCAAACPLGAIQDIVIYKPISLPHWLRNILSIIPSIYLGLAILYAATGTDFIICRYDPFVGIFRMEAPFHMAVLGVSFLLMGMFVARPYCRFLCPYGVLLGWMSRFSRRHLTITPSKCIQCKLCTTSCPFDAIDYPTEEKVSKASRSGVGKFLIYAVLIPVWMLVGGFVGSKSYVYLSKANPTVYLAELLITHPEIKDDPKNIDVQTFLASGKSMQTLVEEARVIQREFYVGSWIFGAFIGLVIGMTLLNQVVYRRREDYEPNKTNCFSCGRCMDFCPVDRLDEVKVKAEAEVKWAKGNK